MIFYASMLCKNAEFPSRESISKPIVVAKEKNDHFFTVKMIVYFVVFTQLCNGKCVQFTANHVQRASIHVR